MVVVVNDRSPVWAVILAILAILVAVAILFFVLTGGAGTVLVLAIPGFPVESIAAGLALGLLLIILRRKPAKPEAPTSAK